MPAPRKPRRPRSAPAGQPGPLAGAAVENAATDVIELTPSTSDQVRAGRGHGSEVDTRPGPAPSGPAPSGPAPSGPGDRGRRHGPVGGRHERPRRSFRMVGIFVLVIGAIAGAYLGLHGPGLPSSAAGAPGASTEPSSDLSLDPGTAKALADAKAAASAAAQSLAEQNRRATEVATRQQQGTSRSGSRTDVPASCNSYTGNRAIGCALLLEAGYGLDQMPCLDNLWTRESHWTTTSQNKTSGAYGIPQALPGDKMAVYGSDWQTNPVPQIKWGLNYIKSRYGDPCSAWAHSQSTGWY